MKTRIIVLALLTALPLWAAEENPKKGQKAPQAEKAGKKPAAKPYGKQARGEKPVTALDEAELQRQLAKHQAERKKAVAAVNESHEVFEALQKDIKGKEEALKKMKAEVQKTTNAVTHLKQKAAAVDKAHLQGHAKEEALAKKIASLEAELKRREQISALEKEAAELSKKAEELRKKAAQLKKD